MRYMRILTELDRYMTATTTATPEDIGLYENADDVERGKGTEIEESEATGNDLSDDDY